MYRHIDDLPLLAAILPPTGVYPVRIRPVQSLLREEQGMINRDLHPLDWSSLIYPFLQDALDNLA